MKASELRIGNLVTIDNPEFWPKIKGLLMQVIGVRRCHSQSFPDSKHDVSLTGNGENYYQVEEFVEPIPLTEEWLEKFGCTQSETFSAFWHFKDISFFHDIEHSRIMISIGGRMKYINFVHDFQNVMALTGEELQIKVPA